MDDACVPTYLMNLLNNPDETSKNRKIAKLTTKDILKDLNMDHINEGCSLSQLISFCYLHKVIYYAFDYKYKLIETNNNDTDVYKNHLPRAVFICANNHLYPITNKEQQTSIFRTYQSIGNNMRKFRKIQFVDDVEFNRDELQIAISDNYPTIVDYIKMYHNSVDKHKIIITEKNICNELFHEEICVNNDIYNGSVRCQDGRVVQFNLDNVLIEENVYYCEMNDILTKLNINKSDKYVSERPMTLAHEYYMKNYSHNIYSHCSPQLYDILTSNMCVNSPVNEFFDRNAETAFDVNKQYTSI